MTMLEIYNKTDQMASDASFILEHLDNVLGCIKTDFNMRFEDWHKFNKEAEVIKARAYSLKNLMFKTLDLMNVEMEKERDA